MNSGVVNMYHNDTDTYIDDPEDFFQYLSWIQRDHAVKKIQTSITHNINAQLYVGPNSHMFKNINMFTYVLSAKWNLKS